MSYVIREILPEMYHNASDVSREMHWFAKVEYQDGIKYFAFDEPYNVKVSDFFDRTNKDNPIKTITMS